MAGGHDDPRPETDRRPIEWIPPTPKIVQLQAWRDQLFGLTDRGEIYRLTLYDDGRGERMSVDGEPLFGGFPRGGRR